MKSSNINKRNLKKQYNDINLKFTDEKVPLRLFEKVTIEWSTPVKVRQRFPSNSFDSF